MPLGRAWLTLEKNDTPLHVLSCQILSPWSNRTGVGRVPNIWGRWRPASRGGGVADPLEIYASSQPCYHAKFGRSRSNRLSLMMEICQKIWTLTVPFSTSFKVIVIDTDLSATYDFLLVLHSNYGCILYRFRGKGQYLQNFPMPYI